MDEDTMELVFEYNDEQMRSLHLIDGLGLSEEEIDIPVNNVMEFAIDIRRNDPGVTLAG